MWTGGDLDGNHRISATIVDIGAYERPMILALQIANPLSGTNVDPPGPIVVSGTATNLAGLSWTNHSTGDSGAATPGTAWAITNIPIGYFENRITVFGTNANGVPIFDHVSVTGVFPGSITITNVRSGIGGTNINRFTLHGPSSNLFGHMRWTNTASGDAGCGLVSSNWDFTVDMVEGVNPITVSGTNLEGRISDTINLSIVITPIIYVDRDVGIPGGAQDGTGWATAFEDLPDALALATTHEIWVAAGAYYPDEAAAGRANPTADDPNQSFSLSGSMTVYGGFLGHETSRTQRLSWAGNTILSGDLMQDDNDGGDDVVDDPAQIVGTNAYSVVTCTNGSPTMDGFIITAGKAIAGGGGFFGSGAGTMRFEKCGFFGHRAEIDGGAVYSRLDRLWLVLCKFQGNTAGRNGGAIHSEGNICGLDGSLVAGNAAANHGGGMSAMSGGLLQVLSSTVAGNEAGGDGGAIHMDQSGLVANNTIVWNNRVAGISTNISSTLHRVGDIEPIWNSCIAANSGGSSNWNPAFGRDWGYNLDQDPRFIDEPTPGSVPTIDGDYALQVTSPAIDMGDNFGVGLTEDLAGNDRIYDDPDWVYPWIDIGAYEAYDDGTDMDVDGISDWVE
ncbi:MAG: choice-of-anchor Q domain-containing protein, partial [Verrucomicrobiota bacterium]